MPLYRAHSLKYINAKSGTFTNPYLVRNRIPKNTSIQLHSAFSAWFIKKFSLDYRSKSIFCTGDINVAQGYVNSSSALIKLAPIKDFRVCYSPKCKDLFGNFQFLAGSDMEKVSIVDDVLDSLEYVEFKNDGLDLAIKSNNEIMVFAERFMYECL
jgi:hypothetical protein